MAVWGDFRAKIKITGAIMDCPHANGPDGNGTLVDRMRAIFIRTIAMRASQQLGVAHGIIAAAMYYTIGCLVCPWLLYTRTTWWAI